MATRKTEPETVRRLRAWAEMLRDHATDKVEQAVAKDALAVLAMLDNAKDELARVRKLVKAADAYAVLVFEPWADGSKGYKQANAEERAAQAVLHEASMLTPRERRRGKR